MGVDALRLLGYRSYQAHRAARTFRRHDEDSVRELAAMRHDRKTYINVARERIRSLEEILRSDLEEHPETADAGWDVDSLRRDSGLGGGAGD